MGVPGGFSNKGKAQDGPTDGMGMGGPPKEGTARTGAEQMAPRAKANPQPNNDLVHDAKH